ncbi:response regulator [Desulfobacterales bacterium HSG2]|nr:response regulator [Desulfobacterales bacterium HSG2]
MNDKGNTILLVDDNKTNIKVLVSTLESHGFRTATARSGEMGIRRAEFSRPDLILLDVMMPGIDGFETCRRLKANEKTGDIPVIFMTALNDMENKLIGFEVGGVDYITKPFEEAEVMARVKTHLTLRHTQRQLSRSLGEITDSIRYAERIQRSLLPNSDEVRAYLPDSFFLWMPRDIVGGDIYFAERFGDGIIVAVIDCTGHGVPGAFMSMIASSFIRRITTTFNCHDPAEILKQLNQVVKTSLQQDRKDAVSDDGLDAAVCFIEVEGGDESSCPLSAPSRVIFAGAKLPLFYVRNREVNVIKGDRQSIGYKRSDPDFEFTNHVIPVESGISFYLSTDGFWDQMREDAGSRFGFRTFGRKRFKKLLAEISSLPFDMQQERLVEAFRTYKGEMRRQDDVTVAGFGF